MILFQAYLDVLIYSQKKNKTNWIVGDIHSEYFLKDIKTSKDLKIMIILIRNPIEVVCAQLYWRTYPQAIKNYKRNFWFSVINWLISKRISEYLKKKYKKDIYILSINDHQN